MTRTVEALDMPETRGHLMAAGIAEQPEALAASCSPSRSRTWPASSRSSAPGHRGSS